MFVQYTLKMIHPDFLVISQRALERDERATARSRANRMVRPRISYHLDTTLRNQQSSGDDLLQAINVALDRFGMVRSKTQRELHNAFLNSICPYLFGKDLAMCADRILAECGWTDFRMQTLAMTPRRFG